MAQTSATPEIGKSIQAGGVNTNYHEYGSGSPVVLIHGSGPGVSAWANWRFALPYLGEQMHAFAYDQIGFGYTEFPQDHSYSLERWLKHLLDFMQSVGLERASFIGNSMGASVALALAVTHPEMVDRLVLMGPTGVKFPITQGLNDVWGYQPSVAEMKRLLGVFTYDHKRFVTDELAQLRYKASMRLGAQEAFSSMFPEPRQNGVDDLASYEDRLASVQAPTLLIHGREDQVIPLLSSQKLLQVLDNAQLHIFGRCGHWTQLERTEEFNHLVRDFLTEKRA
ncbi:MAG: alpha/beta fold hydrolase [Ktedonobacteraceae bacterium]|nr:alpha/beta fold hydrolase [Ktedonobacteraceae bacterium]